MILVEAPKSKGERKIQARLAILSQLAHWCSQNAYLKCECRYLFADRYNERLLDLPDWVYAAIRSISAPTLARWESQLSKGVSNLADNYGNRRGERILSTDAEMQSFVLARITQRPRHIWQALCEQFGDRAPSQRTTERWVYEWRRNNAQLYARLTDQHRYNSHYRSAAGSYSEAITYALQKLEIDATPGDVLLHTAAGKTERYYVIYIIDIFSRRAKGFVARRSNSQVIGQSILRWLLLNWGRVDGMTIRTDRGKEFLSSYTLGCLQALGIAHEACTGRSGWEKPFVERLFGTNARDFMERLVGYCGHSVTERAKLRSDLKGQDVEAFLSPEELQQSLDTWTEHYNNSKHSGEGLDGELTPLEKWATSRLPIQRYADDPRVLDVLLAPVVGNDGLRIVQKDGIHANNATYLNPDGLHATRIGEQVLCREDPWESHIIHVFTADGRQYLFSAEDYLGQGRNRSEVARRSHQAQKEIAEEANRLRAMQRETRNAKVVSLQRYRKEAEPPSDAEQAAKAVVVALDEPTRQSAPPTPQERERRDEIARCQHEAMQPQETHGQRFLRLYSATLQGVALSPEDAAFVARCLDKQLFPGMEKLARHQNQQVQGLQ